MRPIDADCFREKILKFRSKAVEKWGEDGTVQITGVVDSLVKRIDDTPTIDLESLFFAVGKRADNLDKLYTKIQAVTGITPERLLELFLEGYTLQAPDYRKELAVIWLEKIKGYCQGAEYWADFSKECEALDIAISALQSNRWRDAKKEPPPEAEDIILTVADGFGRHTAYGEYEGGKWYEYDEDGGMEEANVTQWMPFPDPAEE